MSYPSGQPAPLDLPRWPPDLPGIAEKRVLEVLRSGLWGSTQGAHVEAVARRLASLHGVAHATCCSTGTIALVLALKAAGVGPGDEVVVPAYTFLATVSAPLLIGAIPVFAEVDPNTLLLDPQNALSRVTERTRAIIPVHLAGAVAEVAVLRSGLEGSGITIIEDAAQAIGAVHVDGAVGTLGHMACLSFQTSKNIAAGEGGAVLTADDRLGALLWSLHNAGRERGGGWYQHDHVGWNFRLTEMQGVIVDAMLDALAEADAARAAGWESLARLAAEEGLPAKPVAPSRTTRHARHLMPWQLDTARCTPGLRDRIVGSLQAIGVPASSGYPCLNTLPAIRSEVTRFGGTPVADLPVTEEAASMSWWLPQPVLLANEDVHRAVVAAMARALN